MLSTFISPLSFILALLVLLCATPTYAIPYNAIAPYPRPYWQATAGLFYHRCSSPTQVEFSKNQLDWFPSAICQRGTCCSNLAKSPMCSLESCGLVDQELRKSEEYKAKMAAFASKGSPTKSWKSS